MGRGSSNRQVRWQSDRDTGSEDLGEQDDPTHRIGGKRRLTHSRPSSSRGRFEAPPLEGLLWISLPGLGCFNDFQNLHSLLFESLLANRLVSPLEPPHRMHLRCRPNSHNALFCRWLECLQRVSRGLPYLKLVRTILGSRFARVAAHDSGNLAAIPHQFSCQVSKFVARFETTSSEKAQSGLALDLVPSASCLRRLTLGTGP